MCVKKKMKDNIFIFCTGRMREATAVHTKKKITQAMWINWNELFPLANVCFFRMPVKSIGTQIEDSDWYFSVHKQLIQ